MMRAAGQPMTIAELKRHMDRRFDRLERDKADRSDLRGLATRRELRRFATKRDLRRFATKRELRVEIHRSAAETRGHFNVIAESLRDEIRRLADGVAQIEELKQYVRQHDRVLSDHEVRLQALELGR